MKLGQCRWQFLAKTQTIGDCGGRIRISVCSPSLHYKTSKPQIQQQGAQGGLRVPFAAALVTFFPPLVQSANRPVGRSHCGRQNVAVTNLRHLAWRHWRGEACRRLFRKAVDFFSLKSGPESSRECCLYGHRQTLPRLSMIWDRLQIG